MRNAWCGEFRSLFILPAIIVAGSFTQLFGINPNPSQVFQTIGTER